ncbi:MAG: hypothetical protein ACFWUE_07295 [Xylanivirga thermophila]|jgi:predicted permease|uniref:hypothetical protein n=1 Tax=Xylanivirga thermophila TaxID=2496273 RepID=UPI0039F51869
MQIQFGQVITQLLVMMFIIVVGIVAKKFKILDEYGDRIVSSLVINITTLALIISTMSIDLDSRIAKGYR